MELILGIVIAVVACIAAYIFMGTAQRAPAQATVATEAPKPEKRAETKGSAPERSGGAPAAPPAGKKSKKDDKKHPQCLFQLKGHSGDITCSRVSMTGKMVATSGEDRRIKLWNIGALPPTQFLDLSPELDHGAAVAMSPDDKFFAVLFARSKEVKIYPAQGAKNGAQMCFSSKHTTDVTDLIWAYSGKYLVTFACKDKEAARLWTPRGEALGTINPGALETYNVVVSPDSRFVSMATMQCDSKIWEVGTDKDGIGFKGKVMELTGRTGGGGASGHSSAVHSVDFGGCSPAHLVADSVQAATGSKDGLCKVWNIAVRYRQNEDPKCTQTLELPDKKPVSHVALSRGKQAQYLATWSPSAGLIFWALSTGRVLQTISTEDTGQVFHMEWFESAFEEHPNLLLTVTRDGRSRVFFPIP
jgi:WD40 repeat protein